MDGWTACCTGWKGDLKARKEAHFFVQNYAATFLCERCYATQAFPNVLRTASKRALLFTNFGPSALRHRARVQHVNYMASAAEKSPWLTHIPGLHLTSIFFDMMHVAHLGILRNLVAAMCIDFVDRDAIAMQQLWVEFKVWCTDNGLGPPRGQMLTPRLLGKAKAANVPELHSCFKATTVKVFMQFIAAKAMQIHDGSRYSEVRASCCWAMAEFQYITDCASIVLQDEEVRRLHYCGTLFLSAWGSLYELTRDRNLLRPKPKLHYVEELVEQTVTLKLNPKSLSNWGEEAMLGKIKRVARLCHAKTMLYTSLKRYFIGLGLRWSQRRQTQCWHLCGDMDA